MEEPLNKFTKTSKDYKAGAISMFSVSTGEEFQRDATEKTERESRLCFLCCLLLNFFSLLIRIGLLPERFAAQIERRASFDRTVTSYFDLT